MSKDIKLCLSMRLRERWVTPQKGVRRLSMWYCKSGTHYYKIDWYLYVGSDNFDVLLICKNVIFIELLSFKDTLWVVGCHYK